MTMPTTDATSAQLYERACKVMPGGVSRNTVLRSPYPPYADHGEGCRITDLDGVTRIDFSNNMCSLLHGHAYPPIVEGVTEQLKRGSAYMMTTETEVEYAENLCARSPSFDRVRFVNSGTEAIMVCLKGARAFTGRPKIAKVEGSYHGGYDYAEASQAPTPDTWGDADHPRSVPLVTGTPQRAMDDVVILPFNDPELAVALLDENRDDIACVLLDLMPHRVGLTPATPEFVHAIREWTTRNGALLALDEVITFRAEVGGLQTRYDLIPDLTALGKAIGGGFPIGAVAGGAEVMELMNPSGDRFTFPLSGTFSANPISTTAGKIAMDHFDAAATSRLNALADRARAGIADAIASSGARACVTGTGSIFRVHMKAEAPRNFREAYLSKNEAARLKVMLDHLFESGFLMINTCTGVLSTPMTEAEIDALVSAMATGFEKISGMD